MDMVIFRSQNQDLFRTQLNTHTRWRECFQDNPTSNGVFLELRKLHVMNNYSNRYICTIITTLFILSVKLNGIGGIIIIFEVYMIYNYFP